MFRLVGFRLSSLNVTGNRLVKEENDGLRKLFLELGPCLPQVSLIK